MFSTFFTTIFIPRRAALWRYYEAESHPRCPRRTDRNFQLKSRSWAFFDCCMVVISELPNWNRIQNFEARSSEVPISCDRGSYDSTTTKAEAMPTRLSRDGGSKLRMIRMILIDWRCLDHIGIFWIPKYSQRVGLPLKLAKINLFQSPRSFSMMQKRQLCSSRFGPFRATLVTSCNVFSIVAPPVSSQVVSKFAWQTQNTAQNLCPGCGSAVHWWKTHGWHGVWMDEGTRKHKPQMAGRAKW